MVTRVNGFSGMDIDSMVKNMMAAKRVPLDKINQQKQSLEWTRETYRDLNSKLVDFRTNKLMSIKKYGGVDSLNAQKAIVTGNTSAITAAAGSSANGVPMKVEVKELAEKSTLSTGILKTAVGQTAKQTDTLGDIFGPSSPNTFDLFINNTTITFNATDSISAVVNKLNGNKDAKIKATFDEISGKLSITAVDYGVDNNLKQTDKDGNVKTSSPFLNLIGISNSDIKTAKSALIKLTNTTTNETRDYISENNQVTANGVVITAKELSGNGPSLIKTETDPTNAIDNIKSFVEDYNLLVNLLNSKISEEKYKDFAPLTDEQKTGMKEDDIKNWTLKAKSGLIKNDDIIKSMLTSMRSTITEQLGELSSFGITTGKYYENGKLNLDESKLRQAIIENPQKIIDILQGPSSAPSSGLFDKMAASINTALDKLVERVGVNKYSTDLSSTYKEESVMSRKLKDYNTRLTTITKNMQNLENRYYKQFAAMETAMNKLTTQSSSLLTSMGQS